MEVPKPAVPDMAVILDALPQAILITDGGGNIRYANETAENLFHYSAAYITKHKLADILPFGSPIEALVDRVLKFNSPINDYQIDISTPRTGQGVNVDVHVSPVPEHNQYALLVFHERGAAERIDRQLNHRNAARSVTGLASMLGHEIKNPLSGIRGAAQLLGSVVPDGDRELTELITNETDRIVKIVDRMEVFSDQSPLEREPVNMHLVLGRIRQLAGSGFGKSVRFREVYDPSLPPASGSTDQLTQAFLNLVKNAAEALDETPKPVITLTSAYRSGIRLARPGTGERASLPLEYTISDNGPGIPKEIQNQVFDPFVSTKINGSGLGLALVAKIIGQHGGTIECESRPGSTTFRILLPAWSGPVSGTEEENA